jgi:hypothetical protein
VQRQGAEQDGDKSGDEQPGDDAHERSEHLGGGRLIEHPFKPEVRLDGQQRRRERQRGRPHDGRSGENHCRHHLVVPEHAGRVGDHESGVEDPHHHACDGAHHTGDRSGAASVVGRMSMHRRSI